MKNYLDLITIVVLKLFKMAADQIECSRLEQSSVIQSLRLQSATHVKYTEVCVL